jgi:hypothetical protein
MDVIVATTVPAWAARDADDGISEAWCEHLIEILEHAAEYGHVVDVFAALEVDGGGDPFDSLREWLVCVNGTAWNFMVDDGAPTITTSNRLGRICAGRNLAIDYALTFTKPPDAILWVDADVHVPPMAVVQLGHIMALAGTGIHYYPSVAGHVPTYCLNGPSMLRPDIGDDLRLHWNTAGFLMVSRDVYEHVRWGHSTECTDDKWYQDRIRERFGTETIVDHTLIAEHHIRQIPPLEDRGHDLTYQRET